MVRRTFQRMDSRPEQFVPSAIPAPLPEKTSGVADDIRSSRGASPPTACLLQGNQTARSDPSVRGIQLEVSRFEQQMADLRADCAPRVEQLETVPLGAVIGASLHDLTRETAMRNVTISLQLNGQLPSIKGDVSLLRQALCSVIANALTAMRDGGRIFVEGRIAPDCKHVEIRISNTLVTYPAKQAQRSCRVSRMRSQGSGGVSLAMAQHLVNRLGGTLRIEQHGEGGTTVILTFLTAFP
jgi:signal transduction histidine kinase